MAAGEGKTLVVFGANGKTGREIVDLAVKDGWKVRAAELDWPSNPGLPEGVEARTADVLSDDLGPLIRGADAVISALGVGISLKAIHDPPPLYTEGTLRIARAMQAAGVRRLVVISATFVASKDRGPLHFRLPAMLALHNVFRDMAAMERILRGMDNIDWTAVRPGWLLDAPLTEDYVVTPNIIPANMIRTRHADLAHFMLKCVENDEWINRTPAIARKEAETVSSPGAVLREMSS